MEAHMLGEGTAGSRKTVARLKRQMAAAVRTGKITAWRRNALDRRAAGAAPPE